MLRSAGGPNGTTDTITLVVWRPSSMRKTRCSRAFQRTSRSLPRSSCLTAASCTWRCAHARLPPHDRGVNVHAPRLLAGPRQQEQAHNRRLPHELQRARQAHTSQQHGDCLALEVLQRPVQGRFMHQRRLEARDGALRHEHVAVREKRLAEQCASSAAAVHPLEAAMALGRRRGKLCGQPGVQAAAVEPVARWQPSPRRRSRQARANVGAGPADFEAAN